MGTDSPEVAEAVPLAQRLARMWLLVGLSEAELEALAEVAREYRYDEGEVIVRAGDPADGIYFVAEGAVQIFAEDEQGDLLLATTASGECFGEMGVIDGEPRSATVSAATPASCVFIPTEPFLDLMERAPSVSMRLCALLSQHLRRVSNLLADLSGGPYERVPRRK
jgi:CRP/FNR family cyclic AMP-dependent transcriptional regulator